MSLMAHELEVIDISDKTQETESSTYSAHFVSDKISPTRKGNRDSIPLTLLVRCTALRYRKRSTLQLIQSNLIQLNP